MSAGASGTAEIIRALKEHTRFPSRIHGPAHWARVHRFGCLLAEKEGLPAHARTCLIFAVIQLAMGHPTQGGGRAGAGYLPQSTSSSSSIASNGAARTRAASR